MSARGSAGESAPGKDANGENAHMPARASCNDIAAVIAIPGAHDVKGRLAGLKSSRVDNLQQAFAVAEARDADVPDQLLALEPCQRLGHVP